MSRSLDDPGVLDPPAILHHHGQPRLEALGEVHDDQLVPGAGRHAGVGPGGLGRQLTHHLAEKHRAVASLLGHVTGRHYLPALKI